MSSEQPDWVIHDFDDNPIVVGTRVRFWDYGPAHDDWPNHSVYVGTVTDLGEWDGDYSDELERAVGLAPRVRVRWDATFVWQKGVRRLSNVADEQTFLTSEWEHDQSGPTLGRVEELHAIAAEPPPTRADAFPGLASIDTAYMRRRANPPRDFAAETLTRERSFERYMAKPRTLDDLRESYASGDLTIDEFERATSIRLKEMDRKEADGI